VIVDPTVHIAMRRQDLLLEADRERLAAQVPHAPSVVRHELAIACVRLANWLDRPDEYFPTADSGPGDWVARSAGV